MQQAALTLYWRIPKLKVPFVTGVSHMDSISGETGYRMEFYHCSSFTYQYQHVKYAEGYVQNLWEFCHQ